MCRTVFLLVQIIVILNFTSIKSARFNEKGLKFYNIENRKIMRRPAVSSPLKLIRRVPSLGELCSCKDSACKCCAGIAIDRLNIDQKVCANMAYNITTLDMKMKVFINDRRIVSYNISARNPPPLCYPVPLPLPVSLCIKLRDITIIDRNVQMCMDWLVRAARNDIFALHLACFRIGSNGIQIVPEESSPVPDDINADVYDEVLLDKSTL